MNFLVRSKIHVFSNRFHNFRVVFIIKRNGHYCRHKFLGIVLGNNLFSNRHKDAYAPGKVPDMLRLLVDRKNPGKNAWTLL